MGREAEGHRSPQQSLEGLGGSLNRREWFRNAALLAAGTVAVGHLPFSSLRIPAPSSTKMYTMAVNHAGTTTWLEGVVSAPDGHCVVGYISVEVPSGQAFAWKKA